MCEIFAEFCARKIYPPNDGNSKYYRRVEVDVSRIRRAWTASKKQNGESLEDMDWLILPSMINRGITLTMQHEDRFRKEQTLAGLYKQNGGERFVRALIPVMSLSRLQAETQLFGEGNFDTWCSFVRTLEAVNAANPITRSLTRHQDEMYYDVNQGAADLLVYGFPADCSRKDLIVLFGIMSIESVRSPFPGAFDVRCLTVEDAKRILGEFNGQEHDGNSISVVALNPALEYI